MPTAISVAGIKEISTLRENTQTDLNNRPRPPASARVPLSEFGNQSRNTNPPARVAFTVKLLGGFKYLIGKAFKIKLLVVRLRPCSISGGRAQGKQRSSPRSNRYAPVKNHRSSIAHSL
ncbi:MAG: hypothetical protein EAZ94_21910 [Oscillatoriales cyanobacterium]|uniref:hypothetical protein n=1 Tax=unclassified Microcoleus TaxID=2642155 RepID=UPI001D22D46E|nr:MULTISPECIES: hypothetical protein [unclassified Microcoleus]TAE09480.1 MAG: hypothetical protein EAZ94_21910 [Oscillatoriales cyanobacterium]MCC3568789.1 hypothetical protein [Microcoleus sp. PH2017_31_RDM_U_A]MCC3580384.1 hypothetical protein [Microcoleus sp. PH2017_32_RDM_D_A]MCC3618540.1 hypothetical protein [Microcoleus sp. PH2017_38_RDM_U_B]TAE20572.1 MAG: hypothetical protein EAZ93_23215 [Oscillatoriales cyanobacterium]